MNDSGFETSSIRQLIIKVTGIDILSIENYEKDDFNQDDHQKILIHFTSVTYPDANYQIIIRRIEFDTLCQSNLTVFKAYFEKFALNANRGQAN
ncbi:MAG: hypothetical protein ABIN24_01970 [Dyadobacter sp.]